MKILFICPRFPYPALKGDQIIVYNRLKELCKSHRIVLLTYYESDAELENMENIKRYCESIITIKLNKYGAYVRVLFGLLNSNPLQVNYYETDELKKILKSIITENEIDIIHIFLLRILECVREVDNIPILLESIDSMQLNVERYIQIEHGIKKFIFREELRRLKKYEPNSCNIANQIVVVAEKDSEYFPTQRISVIPNGVDLKEFYPTQKILKEKNIIAFTGNMGYAPNIHAVIWFVEKCMPILLSKKDNIMFCIAGGNVSNKIKKLHNGKNIIVTGYVKSMGDFLRKCNISIAPMRSGSGMQNKILEAMATGIPVIATKLGLGDIKAHNNKEIIVCETEKEYVDAILKCLSDKEYANIIGSNARLFVEKNHSWKSAAMKISNIYDNMVKIKRVISR